MQTFSPAQCTVYLFKMSTSKKNERRSCTLQNDKFNIIPREARAEGPSVARLINLSGRRPAEGRARELSRENSSRTYIYIYVCMYVYIFP